MAAARTSARASRWTPAGASYITGFTLSTNFPTTPGAFQGTCGSCFDFTHDSYVTKVSPDGSTIEYSTFLGGNDYECHYSYAGDSCNLAVDASGSVYLAGFTSSADFPTTAGAFDRTCDSCDLYQNPDVILTKLNPTGTALVFSTFIGGRTSDYSNGIALDATGAAYLTGRTTSTDFPTTPGAFQREWAGGGYDSFVTKVKPNGSGLVYSTFLGGEDDDCHVVRVAVQELLDHRRPAGAAYLTGSTESYDFPVDCAARSTPQCDEQALLRHSDAYVTKLNAAGIEPGLVDVPRRRAPWTTGPRSRSTPPATPYVIGSTQSADFPTTPGRSSRSSPETSDAFVTKLSRGRRVRSSTRPTWAACRSRAA